MNRAKSQKAARTESGRARPFRAALSVSHEAMLVDGDDETFRHVLFLTRLAADRLATFREAIGRMIGLSGNQYVILLSIAHAQGEGGVTVRDVARYTLMASTHVTTQAGALIKKGLIRKQPHGDDRRSVLLSLTPKGEKAMETIAPARQKFNDAFFVGVSRSALLAAGALLEQVAANSERALPLVQDVDAELPPPAPPSGKKR
jgi:MarR family transcriptional regulator, organic hydroperoxide resistance regulator